MSRPRTALAERIENSINRLPDSGCWVWSLHLNKGGYGEMKHNARTYLAHRLVYEALVGPIPEGMTLDHLCRVKCCVNPNHLEPVTAEENARRGERANKGAYNRAKEACPKGHQYTDENTILSWKSNGGYRRHCRACRAERRAERSAN